MVLAMVEVVRVSSVVVEARRERNGLLVCKPMAVRVIPVNSLQG